MRMLAEWYANGGPMIVPLAIAALAGLAVLAERLVYVVLRSRINGRAFIERVIHLVRAGKLDEALQLCAEHKSAVPDLGLVILRSRSREEGDLENVAETAALTVVPMLTRRLNWLTTLANIAILLGILGAIANLHDALSDSGAARSISAAVAYALRPLGVGILTAIPLIVGHAYLVSQTEAIIGQLEEFSARLINALIQRPDVRLGHR